MKKNEAMISILKECNALPIFGLKDRRSLGLYVMVQEVLRSYNSRDLGLKLYKIEAIWPKKAIAWLLLKKALHGYFMKKTVIHM